MEFKGRYTIPASPKAVWDALHDEAILVRTIPGCETVQRLSDTEFQASAMVRIGPVKARFEGRVELAPRIPEPGFSHALTLKGEGKGGVAGFARGESDVRLASDSGGTATVLEYDAKAIVGGRLAQRLIDGAAKSLADEFFARFAAAMTPALADGGAPGLALRTGKAEEGLAPQFWVAGLIGIVILLLIVFSIVL
jgi:hypothetical protein